MPNGPLKYALKTWQTAVFFAPFIIIAFGLLHAGSIGDAVMFFAFGALTGMVFSVPSALLFWLAAYITTKQDIHWKYKKIILSVIGVTLTMLAFMLYADGTLPGKDMFAFIIIYAAVIVAGVWIYKLRTVPAEEELYPAGNQALS